MLPSAVARCRVKVGVELSGRFAGVDEALIDGRISWEHARVIVAAANPRIVKKMADIQDHLVAAAQGTLFERWRREVAGIADLLDEDGGHDPDDGLSRNRLLLSGTFGDSTEVSGRLVGEWGLVARQAIDEMAAELRRAFKADREVLSRAGDARPVHPARPGVRRAVPPRARCRSRRHQSTAAGCDLGRQRHDAHSRGRSPRTARSCPTT